MDSNRNNNRATKKKPLMDNSINQEAILNMKKLANIIIDQYLYEIQQKRQKRA
ncbi:MAG: hypothetical protein PHR51_00195 [Patescibacteria group bacterium]|nr:hypothetical protein [Patescibacteria group bacterium]